MSPNFVDEMRLGQLVSPVSQIRWWLWISIPYLSYGPRPSLSTTGTSHDSIPGRCRRRRRPCVFVCFARSSSIHPSAVRRQGGSWCCSWREKSKEGIFLSSSFIINHNNSQRNLSNHHKQNNVSFDRDLLKEGLLLFFCERGGLVVGGDCTVIHDTTITLFLQTTIQTLDRLTKSHWITRRESDVRCCVVLLVETKSAKRRA